MSIPQGGPVHLVVQQGATLSFKLVALSDKDDPTSYVVLTGYSGKAEIRTAAGGDLLLALTVAITNGAQGEVTVSALPADTMALTQDGVWDLFLTSIANPTIDRYKLCGGNVFHKDQVTVPS